MFDPSWLWAVFTIVAAAAQTVRNAAQRELTARLGTVGATHVRFLFGFPFALIFLAGVMIALGQGLPQPPPAFWPWVVLGALTQVAATALMLAAMNDRSFVVVYAYIKTEPVQAALFGLVFLGEPVRSNEPVAVERFTVSEPDNVHHAVAVERVVELQRGVQRILGVAQVHPVEVGRDLTLDRGEVIGVPLGGLGTPRAGPVGMVVVLGQGGQIFGDDLWVC